MGCRILWVCMFSFLDHTNHVRKAKKRTVATPRWSGDILLLPYRTEDIAAAVSAVDFPCTNARVGRLSLCLASPADKHVLEFPCIRFWEFNHSYSPVLLIC